MNMTLKSIRQILESQLRAAAPTHNLRESIQIHQVADPVDMTQQAGEREMAVSDIDRNSALVRQLRAAIERLDKGSYGICMECEEEISAKRLKALPWAALCIACQESADRQTREQQSLKTNTLYRRAA